MHAPLLRAVAAHKLCPLALAESCCCDNHHRCVLHPQSKECMLFAGTAVASGSGICIVTSIGMCTEIGKIQEQIQAASQEEEHTPLKQKLDQFGELLAKVRRCNIHTLALRLSSSNRVLLVTLFQFAGRLCDLCHGARQSTCARFYFPPVICVSGCTSTCLARW
jgi:hypothetical protein